MELPATQAVIAPVQKPQQIRSAPHVPMLRQAPASPPFSHVRQQTASTAIADDDAARYEHRFVQDVEIDAMLFQKLTREGELVFQLPSVMAVRMKRFLAEAERRREPASTFAVTA